MSVLVDGVVTGAQLAVLALGFTLMFGVAGIVHLAYGQLVVVAALVASLAAAWGAPMALAAAAGVAGAGALAWLLDVTVLPAVHRRDGEARVLLGLLVTLAVAFVIDGLVVWWRPYTVLSLPVGGSVDVAGVTVRTGSLAGAALALVALALVGVALRFTDTGRRLRAVGQDEVGARLVGVDPRASRHVAVVLGGLLAGVVAVTRGLATSVGAADGFELTVLALVVAVVGGLGSVGGALAAGLLLGLVHAAATQHLGAVYTTLAMLAIAVVAVVARRGGLMETEPR